MAAPGPAPAQAHAPAAAPAVLAADTWPARSGSQSAPERPAVALGQVQWHKNQQGGLGARARCRDAEVSKCRGARADAVTLR